MPRTQNSGQAQLLAQCQDAAADERLQRRHRALAWVMATSSALIADLAGSDRIRSIHIAEAMQWRRALPSAS